MNNANFESALSWDSTIEKESSFTLLEPGAYHFTVQKMERSTFQPSAQSSIKDVSPKAELELKVFNDQGVSTIISENLILHSRMEWKISEFMIAIGQKKPGEPVKPNWNAVVGATGECEVEVNHYVDRKGTERENNRITKFLEPIANKTQPQTTQQQPANNGAFPF